MFDFYESDWFTITLEVVFLIFIVYDIKRYFETKKREYLLNITLTLGFFIWAFIPFYNKYFTWQEIDKAELLSTCKAEHNATYCGCMDDKVFKEYSLKSFKALDTKQDKDFLEFVKESEKECLEG